MIVTIEFEFVTDTADTNEFLDEVDGVFRGIEFVDRFESDTRCVGFAILEVNT